MIYTGKVKCHKDKEGKYIFVLMCRQDGGVDEYGFISDRSSVRKVRRTLLRAVRHARKVNRRHEQALRTIRKASI